ncbi:MAG: nitroreductase family protein [Mycolicibacterium cosmeticum]|nr:nitroreductase family protein [Mycolicibacterium cosmeticum]
MDIYEAVASRHAVRGCTDQSVPPETVRRVLSAAGVAPPGSDIQPWTIYVVTGAPLVELKKRAVERVTAGIAWDDREYDMYPQAMPSIYHERRAAFGRERYSALGIEREDWEARALPRTGRAPLAETVTFIDG